MNRKKRTNPADAGRKRNPSSASATAEAGGITLDEAKRIIEDLERLKKALVDVPRPDEHEDEYEEDDE